MAFLSLRTAVHAAAISYMAWGFKALNTLGGPMGEITQNQYGGHWAFLTILGLWATIFTLGASLLADLTGLGAFKSLKRVLMLIALPVETVISSVYWGIILTVPSLMIPGGPEGDSSTPGVDPTPPSQYFIPLPMDLALHLTPCLVLLVDFFFFEKPYAPPASTYGAFTLASACGVAYGLWAEWCAQHNDGVFAYPFLTIAPLPVRMAIYGGASLGALGFFRALNALKRKEVRALERGARH